jgi:acetate kinase
MTEAILVLNVGSSSIKFAIYVAGTLELLCRGHVDGIGSGDVAVRIDGPRAADFGDAALPPTIRDRAGAGRWLLDRIHQSLAGIVICAAGHRVVHGGTDFAQPIIVDERVLDALENLEPLAPQHQPHNLAAIRMVGETWPGLTQVACFDTAFHRTLPMRAQWFALPRAFAVEGVLRYGFHGLSYEYLAGVLPQHAGARANERAVIAHLGHGASLCALRDRRSVATTMGFTALDGLMMGRRSGAIDPGVLLYLLQQKGMAPAAVEDLLYNQSGLLGVSGISDDLRVLEASGDPHAEEAMDLFAYRASDEIASMAAALEGLDVLVFSGGIGERSASMRRRICACSAWLGIALDGDANLRHGPRISTPDSRVDVFVIPTDEEIVVAHTTNSLRP